MSPTRLTMVVDTFEVNRELTGLQGLSVETIRPSDLLMLQTALEHGFYVERDALEGSRFIAKLTPSAREVIVTLYRTYL